MQSGAPSLLICAEPNLSCMFWLQEMVPVCVARVHSLLPADWDWSGAKATPAALEADEESAI